MRKILCLIMAALMVGIGVAAAAPPTATDIDQPVTIDAEFYYDSWPDGPLAIPVYQDISQYAEEWKDLGNSTGFVAEYSVQPYGTVFWANEQSPVYMGVVLRFYYILEGEVPEGMVPIWFIGFEDPEDGTPTFGELTEFRGSYYIEYAVEFDGFFVIYCTLGADV